MFSVVAVLSLLGIGATYGIRQWRGAHPGQPAMPPGWVNPPTPANMGQPESLLQPQETPPMGNPVLTLSIALNNDEKQVYGGAGVRVYERGSEASFIVALPQPEEGASYVGWIGTADGQPPLRVGVLQDRGDGWFQLTRAFPESDLRRVETASVMLERNGGSSDTLVEGRAHEAVE